MRTKIIRLRSVASAALTFACFAMFFVAVGALADTSEPSGGELVVGTRVAPPFSMKNKDGAWEGISIDLWRRVAERLHLRYRIEERGSVQDLVDAVASGQVDVAVAALTVTAARRGAMDFSQPFFETGLGVAVPSSGITAWLPVLRTFASFRFLQAVLTLLAITLLVGGLIWVFERHENEHYSGVYTARPGRRRVVVCRGNDAGWRGATWTAVNARPRARGPVDGRLSGHHCRVHRWHHFGADDPKADGGRAQR